jgi:hypothetical protein
MNRLRWEPQSRSTASGSKARESEMRVMTRHAPRCVLAGALGVLAFTSGALAKHRPDHPYRYSVVDMPVSLAVGTVRTPEFPVVSLGYWIMVQVEVPLPIQRTQFLQMQCRMGVTSGGLDTKDCSSDDPLLRADWTVWDGEHIVDQGSSTAVGDGKMGGHHIFKFLGKFRGESGRKYILKVKFTKDGAPMNVANPRLIVTKIGDD